ncbi:hypothetical protein EJ04DRAFT_593862 [Polyplosphaeria fusca]|uniref:Uncharacterized protein n=1 Tax=Polyplosphaeria fusca TaxID=682080 RepID=A0A9P4UTH9_9PLEO|nr:hypothetical protein EJ04DRAFT_593862 [Polyplosphaeria fusca]
MGYKLEPRPVDTPQPGGRIEKAGDVIIKKSRALAIDSGLPRGLLAAELVITAINILNHTLIKRLDWRTPSELVHGRKPIVSHFELIGAKADNTDLGDIQYALPEELAEVLDIPDLEYPTDEELAYALLPQAQPNDPDASPSNPMILEEDDQILSSLEDIEAFEQDIVNAHAKRPEGAGRQYLTPGSMPPRQQPANIGSQDSSVQNTSISSQTSSHGREASISGDLLNSDKEDDDDGGEGMAPKDPAWKGYHPLAEGDTVPDQLRNNAPQRGPHLDAAKKKGLQKGMDESMIIPGGHSSRRNQAHAVYLGTFSACIDPLRNMNTEPSVTRIH